MAEEEIPENLEITDELIAERRAEEPGETPEDMTPWQRPITATIDVLNMWIGRVICLLLVPLIFAMVFEVVSRKAFAVLAANDMADLARAWGLGPTLWAYDISRMSGGILFMGAAGYALMRGVHIRADFLYRNWTYKTQATVDAILYLAFYFPAMLFFFWSSYQYGMKAFGSGLFDTSGWERASDSTWAPYLGPARAFMPLGAFLLLLQGFPELFRAFHQMGKDREKLFVRILPIYFIGLAIVFYTVFYPNASPIDDWWASSVGASGLFDFSKPTIGLFMLAAMLFAIFVGFPISFTLIFLAFVFGTWGFGSKLSFFLMTLQTNSVMLDDQLVAVPLFTFMGIMMEKAGLMERLFRAVQLMMSRTRGALYVAVLFVSTIFAAATGIVGASVTILGIMAGKTMIKSGYNVRLAAGTITAGGTLGILIPPSIMLIVMGPVLEVPVTDLFRAAIVPGIMLAGLYLLYSLGRCWLDPSLGPILPPDEQPETSNNYFLEVSLVMLGLAGLCYLLFQGITGALGHLFIGAGLIFPLIWLGVMYACYRSLAVTRIVAGILLPLLTLGLVLGLLKILGVDLGLPSIIMIGIHQYVSLFCQVVVLAFMALVLTRSMVLFRANAAEEFYFSDLWYEFFMGLVPPTVLISFALGSILAGWATPAEAAACGALGSVLLSWAYRKLTMDGFYDALIKTLELSVLIMFLVAASNFFGAVFSNLGTPKMLTELLLSMDMSPVFMLILIMALIFLLGWPLEWVPIVLIIIPILVPTILALDLGFEKESDMLVWFAILVAVNLQTAWLSPPVALSAYFLKGVVPQWDLKDIYLGMMQFMVIQVIGLALIFIFPQIALWLPAYLDGQ
jgi:TRAP-type mannitol/chloroaromatic compound transport system permease large subunit/TRAP-type mannitol/chloroaromatic compound transport system permease small subunit